MSSTNSSTYLLTDEEIAKIISVAIVGFVGGVMQKALPMSVKDLYEVTLDSVKKEKLHQEFIETFDPIIAEEEENFKGNG